MLAEPPVSTSNMSPHTSHSGLTIWRMNPGDMYRHEGGVTQVKYTMYVFFKNTCPRWDDTLGSLDECSTTELHTYQNNSAGWDLMHSVTQSNKHVVCFGSDHTNERAPECSIATRMRYYSYNLCTSCNYPAVIQGWR
jgi:hypothetical protein